jgi:hypothetical protein
MNLVNLIIAMAVAVLMFVGAGMTYHYRMLDAEVEGNALAGVAIVSPTQFVKNVANLHASLPKWDDKNWKGLTHHPAGYYKKNADASKQNAPKQTAAR